MVWNLCERARVVDKLVDNFNGEYLSVVLIAQPERTGAVTYISMRTRSLSKPRQCFAPPALVGRILPLLRAQLRLGDDPPVS